jgi:hypothetical protein
MKEHKLKCWPDYWNAIAAWIKPFEVRFNDRGFMVGDVLVLEKYDEAGPATVRSCRCVVASRTSFTAGRWASRRVTS